MTIKTTTSKSIATHVTPQGNEWKSYIRRQVYHFLVDKAFRGETTTYKELALNFGLPSSGNALGSTLSPILGSILTFCEQTDQPILTVLVVRKSGADKGIPGIGFWQMLEKEDYTRDRKRVITGMMQKDLFDHYATLS